MKCEKCGIDYPKKIWKIHKNMCKAGELTKELSFNEMRREVKVRGLDAGKNPSKASLKALLEGVNND